MSNKDNSMKYLGALALVSTTAFIWLSRKNPDSKPLNGLNIDIDPEKLVESVTNKYVSDEKIKNIIGNIAKSSISKILS